MKSIAILLLVLSLCFATLYQVTNYIESVKPALAAELEDEDLYLQASKLKGYSLGFEGLIADWYWMRSLQYLGKKLENNLNVQVKIDDLSALNPKLLYPLLDSASTLDPQFMALYSFGAAILPTIDNQQAIKLLEKGIEANPDSWQLYQNLGYIYWQNKNYKKAAEIYSIASTKAGAPPWVKQLSVKMQTEGESRDFALEMYKQMFDSAQDEQTKSFAELRYAQIVSLNERDAIQPKLDSFETANKRCPNSWKEIYSELSKIKLKNNTALQFDKNNSPIDPTGVPYIFNNQEGKCKVYVDRSTSKIPFE